MKFALLCILALLGFISGGWMLFDGLRRLLVGDYIRIDGQLGPWRYLLTAISVDPMARGVAVIFVMCGLFRIFATIALLAGAGWGWTAMLISSVAILWYLPVGTATAVITIVLLFLPVWRAAGAHP